MNYKILDLFELKNISFCSFSPRKKWHSGFEIWEELLFANLNDTHSGSKRWQRWSCCKSLVQEVKRVLQVWVHHALLHFDEGQAEIDIDNGKLIADHKQLVFEWIIEYFNVFFVQRLHSVEFVYASASNMSEAIELQRLWKRYCFLYEELHPLLNLALLLQALT